MRKRIFTILSAISLLVSVAALALWLHSFDNQQPWHFSFEIGSPATQCNLALTFVPGLDFSMQRNQWTRWRYVHVTVPAGPIAILSSILPILWFLGRKVSPPAGVCKTCGYDLRATPDRCPECGAETKPQ